MILHCFYYIWSMSFLKEFFKNKSEVGAVAPSSKRLGNKMYGSFDFDAQMNSFNPTVTIA